MNGRMIAPKTPRAASPPTTPEALSGRGRFVWRGVQGLVFLVGLTIFLLLILVPPLGLHAFWNVLIPVAPALLVFAPGFWRNVCPLATAALLPRHLNRSLRRKLPERWNQRLNFFAIVLLLAIVPLRHVILNASGPATALAIASLAILAVFFGFVFEWKSGWCSGLCPVHPVEKLYGAKPALSLKNAHCHSCAQCVSVCPDSVATRHLLRRRPGPLQRASEFLMVGGFPGFIWGWFQVPDLGAQGGWTALPGAYALPLGGMALTLALYAALRALAGAGPNSRRRLVDVFACASVSCYYWFRLPALLGFGPHPGNGMLLDLRGMLPESAPVVLRVTTTGLFFWWLVLRRGGLAKWALRPPLTKAPASGNSPRTFST